MRVSFDPIGTFHSCFKEKFGIPRQAGLVPAATATIEILPPYNRQEAFRDLECFSHIWVLFFFHGMAGTAWRPTVRPPRLGGNRRTGVFATRSGYRPNPIGLSAVRLEGITYAAGSLLLQVSGIDILDQTPVLDIKPYIPYADSLPSASGGFAQSPPQQRLEVVFSAAAEDSCHRLSLNIPHLKKLITGILECDPRPGYYNEKPIKRRFGTRLFDLDIQWECSERKVTVLAIEKPEGRDMS